jgi:hypothetical protein
MRVRVSLDFDILIESFISLCIIETVLAICREYKPWIVHLITQWSKSSKIVAPSLMKHGLTKITAQIICGFRMMGLMPQKYPRVKANVWLFCMHAREVRVWLTAAI